MKKLLPIVLMLILGCAGDGCVSIMENKSAQVETVRERAVATTAARNLLYSESYVAIEYSTDKYEKTPTMKINYYSDDSTEVSFELGGQTGIYGKYPYGIFGEVILYTGSGDRKTTFANGDISIMDGRATVNLSYPMGEAEIIVFEKK